MEFSWIVNAILGIIIIYLLYLAANKNTSYWAQRGVPCQKTVPLFGHVMPMITGKTSLMQLTSEMYKYFEGKKYYGFMIFQQPVLIVRDPDLINQVLVKDFSNFEDRLLPTNIDLDLINAGLASITGDRWRVLRHKLTPTFTSGKMKMMFKQIKECSEEVIHYLKDKNGKELESRSFVFKFVTNVIGSISFGVKVDALNEKTEKENAFYQHSKRFFEPTMSFQFKALINFTSPKLKEFLGLKLVDESVNNFFEKLSLDLIKVREADNIKRNDFLQLMIEQKKNELALISSVSNENNAGNKKSPSSVDNTENDADEPEDIELLDLLKQVKCDKNAVVFTDRIIAGQTFLFISGGSDTVSTVLSFALHYLALNMDVQNRLHDEIDAVFKTHEFNYEAVRKMTYMEQVLNEVMRLHPPGGIIARICTEDYKLPGTDLVIEKGSCVQIPVVGLHTDPEYFPNPQNFDPDRFQNMDSIPKGVFFPFGGGPRMCLAMRLAMLEMKVFLAAVVSNFNIILDKRTQMPLKMDKKSILQHVEGGLWVRFESRS